MRDGFGSSVVVAVALFAACTPVKNSSRAKNSSESAEVGGSSGAGNSNDAGRESTSGAANAAGRSAANTGGTSGAANASGTSGAAIAGGTSGSGDAGRDAAAAGNASSTRAVTGGGAGGASAPAGAVQEVRGKVVDFYLQPAAAVSVSLGAATTVTDSAGEFRVADVPATYDVTLLVTAAGDKPPRYVWRYEGLTRRDPTLQVDVAGAIRSGAIELQITGADFANLPSGDTLLTSFGSASGLYNTPFTLSATFHDRITWSGPNSVRFTAHGLRFFRSSDEVAPSAYYAHDSQSFELANDGTARIALNLAKSAALATSTLQGAIENAAGTQPQVEMYLRFADHSLIPLAVEDMGEPSFSYAIPRIPDATITLTAASFAGDGMLLAHVDGLDAPSAPVVLRLPEQTTLTAPATEATVDAMTRFQWSGADNVFVFHARGAERGDRLRVVTSSQEARLPFAPGADTFADQKWGWWVETHGSYASVDEAAGPKGFLDTCAYRTPTGPERGTGTFTETPSRAFALKP